MKRKTTYLLYFLFINFFISLQFSAQITELFFSEYAEGSSNNKYLEIYNGTNATVNLDNYAFPNVSNAPTTPGQYEYWNTFPTGATIAPGDVYVIAHPSADPAILAHADHTFQYLSNGDDGFALVSGGTHNDSDGDGNIDAGEMVGFALLDHIGNWAGDPGTGWDVAGVSNATANHTLVRKGSVTGPNPCWDQTCGNSSAGTNATDSEWIVYPVDTWTYLGSHSISSPLVGTWKLAQQAGALAVGPNQGDGSWWSNSTGDLTARACIFDDSISFDANGNFTHYMDGSTWVENWQDSGGDRCASPVSPHAGGSFTYTYTGNQLTVTGSGAHIGLPKATNQGELSATNPPALPSSRTYEISFGANGEMIADINFGGGWWRSVYVLVGNPPPPTYNVTLKVNTANITVGPNGMYAGGGILGDAVAVPLSDADGDGTWEGVISIADGTSGNYIFLNSPANGGDWGAKEDLSGQSCSDPNNWNDRIMPTINGDTTLLHCFGTCDTDGTCPVPPSTSNVTFSVDMNTYAGSQTAPYTVYINGTFNGWNGTSDPMSDADGDGVWDVTLPLNSGDSIRYKFTVNGWNDAENFAGGEPCTNTNLAGFTDRVLTVPSSDSTLGTVCFNSCSACPPPSGCYYVIDMQDSYGDGWNGASIAVSVNGAAAATWGLSGGSSGTDSLETLSGDVVDFSFTSGTWDSEITFQITDPSGAQIYNGGAPSAGSFLTDTSNSSCVPVTVNVTFQMDMGLIPAILFTTPEVNGTWNNWCGNCNPMTDADGDGIWEATIPLLSGIYEYKYTADAWTIQEMNDPTAPCTNGDTTYTNRTLSVGTSDITLPVVCWGSCDACVYPPQAPAGLTCSSGNPGFVFTDDIDPTTGWSGDIGTGNGIWKINSGGTPSSGTGPSGAHSGNDYLFFESSTGGLDTATAITPAIDLTAGVGDAELTFWMHAYGSGINTLDVGVSTSATGPFTNLYTWSGEYHTSNGQAWNQVGVNLASYVGQTVYVAFTYTRGTAGISYEADLAIDYVQVASCLNCVAPSALMASNISANSADVSWTPGGIETEWLMVVNGASSVVTSTTQALTGLMSNTQYDVQVAAICGSGDTSLIAGPVSFTTPCANAVAPYLEDFSAGALPVCFSQSATTGSGWVFSGTPGYDAGSNGRAAGTYAWIDFSGTDVGAVMEVIGVDVSALTTPELAFDYFSYDGTNGSTPANILYVEAHDGSSWVAIDSLQDNTVAGWNQLTYDLTGFDNAGVVTLRFRGESGGSSVDFYNDLLVDEIIVRETPSCYTPSAVTAISIGADTASFSWSADPSVTAWNYVVGIAGFDPLLATPVASTTNSVTVTGLTGSTTYDFYVQSDCGTNGVSTWVGPYSFTTIVSAGTCGYFNIELTDSYGDGWNGNGLEVVINGTPTDTLTVATGTFASFQIAVNIGDVIDLNYLNTGTWGGENGWNVIDNNGNTIVSVAPTNSSGSAGAGPANTVGITACPACSAPTGVMASNITTNSADVSWTASGSETEWWFVLDGVGQSVTSTTNALTGLTSATVYTVEIAAICGAGDTSSLTLPYTFATACGVASAPYLENFDAGLSPCWTQDTADVFDWTLDANGTPSSGTGPSDDVTGGGNYMYTEASSPRAPGDSAIMMTEDIDISSLTNPQLRFYSHMYGTAQGTMRVDMYDGANYTTVFSKSGDQGDVWVEESVLLNTTATVVHFKITAVLDTNSGGQTWPGDMAIDNFEVREEPTCADPSGLTLGTVTSDSVSLSWTPGGNETQWLVYLVDASGSLSTTTPTSVNSSSTILAVNSSTAYSAYVQSVCPAGDSSIIVGPQSFITPCNFNVVEIAPYLENFDNGLNCWTQETTDDFDWTIDAFGTPSSPTGPSDDLTGGGNYLYIETSFPRTTGDSALVHTNNIDISSLTNPQLRFYSHMYGVSIGELSVWITDASGTLSQVFIKNGDQGDQWNQELISLSNYSGTVSFTVLAVVSDDGAGTSYWGDIAIDNFEVRETPSCPDPSGLTVGTVTADSADISWTPGGSQTQWNVYVVDTGSLANTTPILVNTPSVSLGLFAQTTYSVFVQGICGSGDTSLIAGPVSFTTPCANAVAPYLEDFSAGALPVCFSQSATTGSGWVFSGTPGYDAGSNGRAAGTYAWIDFSGTDVGAVMEVIGVDVSALTTPELAFDYFSYDGTNGSTPANILYVEAHDGSSWVAIDSLQDNTVAGWNQLTYDLTGFDNAGVVTLRFRGESGGSSVDFYNDLLVDEIIVRETPSCYTPSAVTAISIGADTASFSWSADPSVTAWNYVVGIAGFDPLLATPVASTTNSVTVTGLTGSTTYDFYVQSDCGTNGVSTWVGPYSFTTIVSAGTCGYFNIELTDSYGDGWNGNGLEVVINGTPTDTLTVATGTFASFQIAVNIGDVIDLNYLNTGTWGGENGWNVIDNNGNTIVSVAPTNSSGSAGAGPANTVGITACPACSAPTGVMASNITTNSADVSWTASGSETEWWFVLDGVGQSVTSTTNALTGLTSATVYTVEIAAICGAGDTSSLTLPYTFATACGVASAPYLENFDAGLSPCWTQDTADVFDWTLDANGTPSSGTGPSDDVTGGGNYMYTEASVPRAHGDVATMMTGDIDISSLTNPELNFYSHMFGTAIGTMTVDMYDGANYTTVFSKSGDQGDVWVEESVLLNTTATVVHFKITAVLDTNSAGLAWPGDMAIDNFGVVEAAANDLAIVDASVPSGCDFDSTQYVSITVVNQGLVTENTFDASYSLNGAASVTETNSIPINPGDTLIFPFFTGVDMTLDGVYSFDFSITSAVDTDLSNNNLSVSGENFYTPGAPSTTGDTICDGDTAHVMGMSADGPITWYDAMTGGNVVGSGDNLHIAPTATTSYYAEAKAAYGFSDDFESYNVGDFIAQSDTVNWATWPGGTLGGLYDAPVSNAQAASGSNSLHLDNAASNVPDPVLPFGGQTWTSGSFEFSTNIYVETTAYFNLQGSATIGTVWAMEMTFTGAGGLTDPFIFDLGGGALTGSYPGTGTWFNVTLKCADLTTGTWELFIDGVSKGTATLPNGTAVGGCNLYAAAGNNYYIDDISWSAIAADACTGARTEAVVTVNDCSNITELTKGNMEVYPNPNNGEFVITTSNEVMNVTITDVRGKVVYTNNTVNNNTINVNLSDLERGMYMINVETTNGNMTENVIVQ